MHKLQLLNAKHNLAVKYEGKTRARVAKGEN